MASSLLSLPRAYLANQQITGLHGFEPTEPTSSLPCQPANHWITWLWAYRAYLEHTLPTSKSVDFIAMQSLLCDLCSAIFAMQFLRCILCYAIFALQSLLCNICCAVFTMQSLLCDICCAISAMRSLMHNLCYVIFAMQSLPCKHCYAVLGLQSLVQFLKRMTGARHTRSFFCQSSFLEIEFLSEHKIKILMTSFFLWNN